jgi:hypothetical protein
VVRLKVGSIDSERMLIHIESAKGGKDRYAMLSPRLLDILVVIPAGAGNQFHRHPGDQWWAVQEGEVTHTIKGQSPRVVIMIGYSGRPLDVEVAITAVLSVR